MTLKTKWKRIQKALKISIDGAPGNQTADAVAEALDIDLSGTPSGEIPLDTNAAIIDAYGNPGDENNLVEFLFPYPMHLYTRDGEMVSKTRVHKDCAESLNAIFKELLDTYGLGWIQEHGLNVYCGCFNFRKMRGGSNLSRHSWGIAIDLNCGENGNKVPWQLNKIGEPSFANMPTEAIRIFQKHGWKSAATAWHRDAMHFQRTQ